MREQPLSHLPWFVSAVTRIPGIRRIALVGSITTNKPNPKDIDYLIEVEDEADLEPLARLGRKMQGRVQQISPGADIFLANPQGHYVGRTCHWKDCRPGARRSCDALNCGRRSFLHDDLSAITLSDETIRSALEVWPTFERRSGLPEDLKRALAQLRSRVRTKPEARLRALGQVPLVQSEPRSGD